MGHTGAKFFYNHFIPPIAHAVVSMEDSMFRRLEHKPKNDEETVIGPTSPVTEKETVIETEISFDEPVTNPEPMIETTEEPTDVIPEPPRKPENRLSFSDGPEPRRTEPVHTPEPVPEEPHKKTAVEVVFGPNNRKKRREEAARLESQRTFDEETSHPEPEEDRDERRLEI